MDDNLFAELVESIHQAGKYRRGEGQPSRITEFPDPDVKAIREATHLFPSPVRLSDRREAKNFAELGTEACATDRPGPRFAPDRGTQPASPGSTPYLNSITV